MAQRARGTGDRPAARAGAPGRAPGRSDHIDDRRSPLRSPELASLRNRLQGLVEPVVTKEGLDLEEVTVSRAGQRYLVRITVDADGGIGHDELSDVSRVISVALDEAERTSGDLTPGAYTLELSSPGVDRPLTLPRHWSRNVGRLVTVRVGGRQVTGRIAAVSAEGVSLDVGGKGLDASFPELGPGHVQVEFARLAEMTDEEIGPEISDGDGPASAALNSDSTEQRHEAEDES